MADLSELPVSIRLIALEGDVAACRKVLGMLIAWLPQSANSPIRIDEAEQLLKILDGPDEDERDG